MEFTPKSGHIDAVGSSPPIVTAERLVSCLRGYPPQALWLSRGLPVATSWLHWTHSRRPLGTAANPRITSPPEHLSKTDDVTAILVGMAERTTRVTAELVRSVAAARESHTALVLLSNGMVVTDVPLPRYDGQVIAHRHTVREVLRECGDDAERAADRLNELWRDPEWRG